MQRSTLFSAVPSTDEIITAFSNQTDVTKQEKLRQHLAAKDMATLAQEFPSVTVYFPSYENEVNRKALFAPVIPEGLPKRFYLSLTRAQTVPNHSSVLQYVAISMPSNKLDLNQLVTQGRAVLLQQLQPSEVAILNRVNAKVVKAEKEGSSIANYFQQSFRKCIPT